MQQKDMELQKEHTQPVGEGRQKGQGLWVVWTTEFFNNESVRSHLTQAPWLLDHGVSKNTSKAQTFWFPFLLIWNICCLVGGFCLWVWSRGAGPFKDHLLSCWGWSRIRNHDYPCPNSLGEPSWKSRSCLDRKDRFLSLFGQEEMSTRSIGSRDRPTSSKAINFPEPSFFLWKQI